MKKIVTMGEIMLRLSTPNNEKFIQADEFDINYGGGEANVAVSCAFADFVIGNGGYELGFVSVVRNCRSRQRAWRVRNRGAPQVRR